MSEPAPATLEGWYALHQAFDTDRTRVRSGADLAASTRALWQRLAAPAEGGWSAAFRLVGGGAEWLFLHFRPTLEQLAEVQRALRCSDLGAVLLPRFDYLSVTEAGLYHATAEVAARHEPGSASYTEELDDRMAAETASEHVRSRLYPEVPNGMRYVSFYPMSKRRTGADNWYALPIAERSRLMRGHGITGRRYAGKIFQVITGSVGLDDWEWGVTLFAHDPLEFKRIVTEMRYDDASARYGEFGRFFTGIRTEPRDWTRLLAAPGAAGR